MLSAAEIVVEGQTIRVTAERNPEDLKWDDGAYITACSFNDIACGDENGIFFKI